jgi:hypothetical protein
MENDMFKYHNGKLPEKFVVLLVAIIVFFIK